MLTIIQTDKAPRAIGPYSQAIEYNGLLFVSGQIPINPVSGNIESDTIETQAKQVMENIQAILEINNLDFSNVIKTTCYLLEMNDFSKFNEIYASYFISKPARACLSVKELPKGSLCEIECIAYK